MSAVIDTTMDEPLRPATGGLRLALDRTYAAAGVLGAACIALICVLMVVQTLGRQFGFPTGAINDLVSWLCAAAAFLTMAHAFKHGDFVRVTLVLEKCAPGRGASSNWRAWRGGGRHRLPRVLGLPLHLAELGIQRGGAGPVGGADLDPAV